MDWEATKECLGRLEAESRAKPGYLHHKVYEVLPHMRMTILVWPAPKWNPGNKYPPGWAVFPGTWSQNDIKKVLAREKRKAERRVTDIVNLQFMVGREKRGVFPFGERVKAALAYNSLIDSWAKRPRQLIEKMKHEQKRNKMPQARVKWGPLTMKEIRAKLDAMFLKRKKKRTI